MGRLVVFSASSFLPGVCRNGRIACVHRSLSVRCQAGRGVHVGESEQAHPCPPTFGRLRAQMGARHTRRSSDERVRVRARIRVQE